MGVKGFQKGHPVSEETRAKISKANDGNFFATCDYCGKEFHTKRSAFSKRKRHFCCRECYAKYRAEKLPKEEQNAYGTGLTEEERKKRGSEREFGYNLGTGGEHGPTGSKWSDESRENHMNAICSKPRNHSEEKKKRISEGLKRHYSEHPIKNSYFSIVPKEERNAWDKKRSKRILCVETGDIFIGAKSAAEWAGVKNRQNIYFCCEGIDYHKTAGGYHWKYIE